MEIYLLKSAACLAIFFVFYKVFLENTSFHKFKRGYLLGSLATSFIIPLITFTTYIESELTSFSPVFSNTEQVISTNTMAESSFNHTTVLLIIYGFGVLFFSYRFIKNLYEILYNIKKNTKMKQDSFIYILLNEYVAPHTFLNNIFFHKASYEAGKIPKEVMWHEETHATQKHSLDILFIECIQVIFWFNPLIYLFKRTIKLNHEFLADSAVLERQEDTKKYQKILLNYINSWRHPSMANAINYSSIKKRFTVMKTKTSKRNGLIKGLLLVPLLSILIYGFSTTQELVKVEKNNNNTVTTTTPSEDNSKEQRHLTARSISIKILDTNFMEVEGVKIPKKSLYESLGSLNTDITKKQRDRIINIHVTAINEISYEDLLFIRKIATTYGYHRIITPKEEIIRSKGNLPMAPESEIITHNTYANEYITGGEKNNLKAFVLQIEISEIIFNGKVVPFNQLVKTVDNYTKNWSTIDFKKAQPSVLIASTPKEYLEKINIEFKKTKFSKVNGGMNIIPPPPPSPIVKKGEKSTIPPPPPAPKVSKVSTNNLQLPPPPPPPPSSLGDVTKKYKYSYVVYVNGEDIYLNGSKVKLSEFKKAMDIHTENWPDEAFKLYGVSLKKEHTTNTFIEKLNKEYRKTVLAKKSSSNKPYLFSKLDN